MNTQKLTDSELDALCEKHFTNSKGSNVNLIAELVTALHAALNTIKALDEDYDLRDSYKQGLKAIQKAKKENQ